MAGEISPTIDTIRTFIVPQTERSDYLIRTIPLKGLVLSRNEYAIFMGFFPQLPKPALKPEKIEKYDVLFFTNDQTVNARALALEVLQLDRPKPTMIDDTVPNQTSVRTMYEHALAQLGQPSCVVAFSPGNDSITLFYAGGINDQEAALNTVYETLKAQYHISQPAPVGSS